MDLLRFLIDTWIVVAIAGLLGGVSLAILSIVRGRGRRRLLGGTAGVLLCIVAALWTALFALAGPEVRGLALDADRFLDRPAPNFTFIAYRPEQPPASASLEDYRGRVVLLQFWASWCGGSSAGMPHLSTLAETHQSDAVILAISDEPREQLERYLAANPGLRQVMGRLEHTPADPYTIKVRGRPFTFVIDKQGVLREYFLGSRSPESLARTIEAYR